MESVSVQLQPFFAWLVRSTVQASVLICLILLVQLLLRRKLGSRWCHALWLVLLLRMVLPWVPQSRASIFNLIPRSVPQIRAERAPAEVPDDTFKSDVPDKRTGQSKQVATTEPVPKEKTPMAEAPAVLQKAPSRSKSAFAEVADILPLIWLAGAAVLGIYICANNFSLLRIVRRERPLTEQTILDLLEDCKAEMGIRIVLGIVATDKVKSASLFGFVRPRLLLPAGMIETLSREELRYVFLHELAHLKRHDIYLGWLTSILQVLHWFNPLVWLAFYRMRVDRELACDALVLARTQASESKDYGRTIVSLLERFSCPKPLPAMAGILETKAQLKRRITMIAKFKKGGYRWSPLAAVVIVLLTCVALPDAIHEKTSAEPAPHITLRQVWSGRGVDACGAPSPDGRYLSYTDWETGDLAVYEIATGRKRRLTNDGFLGADKPNKMVLNSKWSPDSRQIIYDLYTVPTYDKDRVDGRVELRIAQLDGTTPRILYSNENVVWAQTYDWSPDGTQVLACFSHKDEKIQNVLVSTVDGSTHALEPPGDYYPNNMCFSPDGRFIAYDQPQGQNSGNYDVSVTSTNGEPGTPLIEHPADDRLLDWTPDGKSILFISNRTGDLSLWSINVIDGRPQGTPKLVRSGVGGVPLGLAENGSFYYCTSELQRDVYVVEIDSSNGEILAPPEIAVNRFEGFNMFPDYSPDGLYMAYISMRAPFSQRSAIGRSRIPGRAVLCIRSLKDGETREVPTEISPNGPPRWSADAKFILVFGYSGNTSRGIHRINVETGHVTPVAVGETIRGQYAWSHDGNAVFFVREHIEENLCQILVRDLESDEEKELYREQSRARFSISISPDGRWLAFVNNRGAQRVLKIIPTEGGEPRVLYSWDNRFGGAYIWHTWSSDGRYILLTMCPRTENGVEASEAENDKWALYRIPVRGGKPQKLYMEIYTQSLSAHPDGKRIAFSAVSNKDSGGVWVMENFLPTAPVARSSPGMMLRRVRMESGGFMSLSPDGKYLCDVDWDTGNLVLRELATGNVQPLTDKGSWEQFAGFATISTISRDSKKVAFLWYNHERQCFDLREIGLDGSGDRVVRRFLEKDKEMEWLEPAAWSPDGKQILVRFSIEEERNQIAWVSITDGSMRTVKVLNESWPGKIDVSPDGRYIVYDLPQEEETSRRDIFAFDIEENREVPLVQHPADDKLMGWTPDGRHIFFTSNRMGSWDGWILPVARGEPSGLPELVKASMGDVSSIGFTPGGSFYYTPAYGPRGVYTAALDLQTGKVLSSPRPVRHTGTEELPDWSPDGKYLAYCTRPRGEKSQIIHIRSVETGQERQLDAKLPHFRWLRWSPEGRSILVGGLEEKNLRNVVYKVDVLTGERTVVLRAETGMIPGAALFPDGKALIYSHWDGAAGSARFMVRDLETGLEKQLVRAAICPHPYLGWALSPDGKQLAFILEFPAVRTLNTISTTGGQPKELLRMKEEQASDVAWTGDSQNVLFMRGNALWRIPAEGGEPRKLWTWEKRHLSFEGICVHPDGQNLAFGVGEMRSEVWVVENFLPAGE